MEWDATSNLSSGLYCFDEIKIEGKPIKKKLFLHQKKTFLKNQKKLFSQSKKTFFASKKLSLPVDRQA